MNENLNEAPVKGEARKRSRHVRKVPKPTYLYQPDGIIVLDHKGMLFRIHIYTRPFYSYFRFYCESLKEFHLWDCLTNEENQRYNNLLVLWRATLCDENPDPEMPHKALRLALDGIVRMIELERAKKDEEWRKANPKGSILDQLRERARKQNALRGKQSNRVTEAAQS